MYDTLAVHLFNEICEVVMFSSIEEIIKLC